MLADEDARKLISKPKRRGVIVPCKSGLVCRRIALETKVCRAVNVGPCTVANSATEAAADCDEDGNYAPRQCRLVSSTRKYNCRCVHLNGTDVSGTGVEVDSLREAPDCKDIGKNVHNVSKRCIICMCVLQSFRSASTEQLMVFLTRSKVEILL